MLSALYESERSCLLRIAVKAGVPRDEAADVVHTAFVEAIEHAEHFRGAVKSHLRSWLPTVVRHRAVDARRHRGRIACVSLDTENISLRDTVEHDQSLGELSDWLGALLDKGRFKNEENHRLLCEHYLRGRSIEELAMEAGVTVKSVECRLRRLRQKLRTLADKDARLVL